MKRTLVHVAAWMLLSIALSLSAAAQFGRSKEPQDHTRTLTGRVFDRQDNPISKAVVYLKNVHTQDIITHLSDSDGTFRFSGLDLNVDYEIHDEKEGVTSSTRSISNFDTRKEFVLTLRLDHKKVESNLERTRL